MATFLFSLPLPFSIAVLVLSAGFCFLMNLRSPKSPAGPRGIPILGYIPFLRRGHLHRQFTALAEAHGPIYQIQAANKSLIVVSSPTLAREVLLVNESTFLTRPVPIVAKILSYGGSDVATLPSGPEWAVLRKVLVRKALSNRALDTCRDLRESAVAAGIREICAENAGKPTPVFEAAFKLVVNSTLAMLWGGAGEGIRAPDFAREYGEATREMTRLLGRMNVSDAFPLVARFDLQGIQKEAAELVGRFDRIVSGVIERRLGDLAGKKQMVCNVKKPNNREI